MAEVEMEKENEESLIALTTHFAQVQFRLKQIISAEPQHKEALLHDLEEFAFQGCKPMTYDTAASGEHTSTEAQRHMRTTLMTKLQNQLTEIERCAEEAAVEEEGSEVSEGSGANSMAEKQKIIIEELRKRFDLQFGNLDELSTEEVKQNVEKAMTDVVDPIKSKEEYVEQLQSQIADLERYISFLQDAHPNRRPLPSTQRSGLPLPRSHDTNTEIHIPHHKSHDSKFRKRSKSAGSRDHASKSRDHATAISQSEPLKLVAHEPKEAELVDDEIATPTTPEDVIGPFLRHGNQPVPEYRLALTQLDKDVDCLAESSRSEWGQESSLGEPIQGSKGADDLRLSLLVMRKTLAVMQVITLCQCGGTVHCLPKTLKEMGHKNYHRALHTLEEVVDKIAVITAALSEPGITLDTRVSLETDLHETVSMTMADSLRILLEHGLLDEGRPVSFSGGCFPAWREAGKRGGKKKLGGDCPAWRVFTHYYTVKKGKQFSNKTDQLLASSFAIPTATNTSMKKTLLSSIHRVDNTYQQCHHRASDTKFRALVCEGFNVCHLAEWFRIIASQPSIGEDLYSVTSFLATTGLRPVLGCLERLKDNPQGHTVDLPRAYYMCPEAYQPKAM